VHPFFLNGRRIALYLIGWGAAGLLLAAAGSLATGQDLRSSVLLHLPPAFAWSLVPLSAWWLCRSMPLGRTPARTLVPTMVTACLIAGGAWAFISGLWSALLARAGVGAAAPPSHGAAGLSLFAALGSLVFLLSIAAHYLLMAFEASRAAETRALESNILARESELKALRAQINPHFLFNSLNSISALTSRDPAGARRMCLLLSEFMRSTLRLGALDAVPLREEIALVESFLSIEQIRFGGRLRVALDIPPDALPCLLPPLLLQPLVENAVRHGISELVDGGTISITAARRNGRLELSVANPCDPERPGRRGTGVGLRNVRARLAAAHPQESSLDVSADPSGFQVSLGLPARVSEGEA